VPDVDIKRNNQRLPPAMNYPIPTNPEEIAALRYRPVDETVIAAAIAGVIRLARLEGRSLEELTAEVMADDRLLEPALRQQLSDLVAQAWVSLPEDVIS